MLFRSAAIGGAGALQLPLRGRQPAVLGGLQRQPGEARKSARCGGDMIDARQGALGIAASRRIAGEQRAFGQRQRSQADGGGMAIRQIEPGQMIQPARHRIAAFTGRFAQQRQHRQRLRRQGAVSIAAAGGEATIGALLGAERDYPGIPKFPIRDCRTSPLCGKHSSYEMQLDSLLSGKLEKTKLMKIAGESKGRRLMAINDVFVHNANPVSAIRYKVLINGERYHDEIVGDGVGVATIHGSTSYYRSITHSIFRVGIGLAFSNSTEVTNHLVLPEESVIEITITRGPAVMVADNSPDTVRLAKGDSVRIYKTDSIAEIYGLDFFMCPECRKLRHPSE